MGELESNAVRAFRQDRDDNVDHGFKGIACTVLFGIASQIEAAPDSEQHVMLGFSAASLLYTIYSFGTAIRAEILLRREQTSY